MNKVSLKEVLQALGDLLDARGESFEVAVIGGGGLLLSGRISRATRDLDAVGIKISDSLISAHPLPDALATAVQDIAALKNLPDNWFNGGPTDLLRLGLPTGFLERCQPMHFGGLKLFLASDYDQIHFKLYASVDQGPKSKHYMDLKALDPQEGELLEAAKWCCTHDISEPFRMNLIEALQALGISDVTL